MTRILLGLFTLCLSLPSFAAEVRCRETLTEFRVEADGTITFNHGFGSPPALVYPLEMKLKNLGLQAKSLRQLGPRILLVGEGYGEMLPVLDAIPGVDVRNVDPIFKLDPPPPGYMGDGLYEILNRYRGTGKLIATSADHVPLPDDWADTVVSHMVLNNLGSDGPNPTALSVAILVESLRVTRPGGTMIFAISDHTGNLANRLVRETADQLGYWTEDLRPEIVRFDVAVDHAQFGRFTPAHWTKKYTLNVARITLRKPHY